MIPMEKDIGFVAIPFSISSRGDKTFTMAAGTNCIILGFGLASTLLNLQIFMRANGEAQIAEIHKGGSVTVTPGTNTVTVTNGTAGVITGYVIVFGAGSVTLPTS